jgi:hypothetical protein
VKNDKTLHWWLCGFWCAGGALAAGALVTYLTNWPIGLLAGLATTGLISFALQTSDRQSVEFEDDDLADELRAGIRYSNHPGNVLKTD